MNFSKYLKDTFYRKSLLFPFLKHVVSLLMLFYALHGCVSYKSLQDNKKN